MHITHEKIEFLTAFRYVYNLHFILTRTGESQLSARTKLIKMLRLLQNYRYICNRKSKLIFEHNAKIINWKVNHVILNCPVGTHPRMKRKLEMCSSSEKAVASGARKASVCTRRSLSHGVTVDLTTICCT